MIAKQVSKRGGILYCESNNTKVYTGGYANLYITGDITFNNKAE